MKFTSDLASIYGYLCGDGYVIRNPPTQKQKYYMIGFRNTNGILLSDFQDKFHKVFGVRPHIENNERCRIGSKEIYFLLTKNQSFYSHHWTLPELSKKQLACWLRSYFDCDGWCFVKGKRDRHIGLDSVNHKGIVQVRNALKKFGIESKIKPHRYLSRLYIFGKDNLVKFKKHIGFLHPEKSKRLDKALESYVNYYWNFPVNLNELRPYLIKILKSKRLASSRVRVTSIKEINLIKLKKHIKHALNIDSKLYGPKRNGYGSIFYELSIQRQEDVQKIENL